MSGHNYQVRGVDAEQALRDLGEFERKLRDRAVRSGLVSFIRPIKSTAKQLAPQETGAMARAIGHRQLSRTAKARLGIAESSVALLVGPNRRVNGRYQGRKGLWHEFGTEHMEANPFMAPALERNQGGGETRFYEGLRKAMGKFA